MATFISGLFAGSKDNKDAGFQLENGLTLCITRGDVTKMSADAMAVEEDSDWLDNGAVVRWLLSNGGRQYQNARGQLREQVKNLGPGDGVFTCAVGGDLNFRHIIHVMAVPSDREAESREQRLKQTYHKVAHAADSIGATSLILPLFGLGFPPGDSKDSEVATLQAAVNAVLKTTPTALRTVTVVVANKSSEALFKQSLSHVLGQQSRTGTTSNAQESALELTAEGGSVNLPNGVKVKLAVGDVTAMKGDAIVVGENDRISGSGGMASFLIRAGGDSYKQERRNMLKSLTKDDKKNLVFSCSAGEELKFIKVIHVIVPGFKFPFGKPTGAEEVLQGLYSRVFTWAQEADLPTLHTPLLGSGKAGADFTQSLSALLKALSTLSPGSLREVSIVENDSSKATSIGDSLEEILASQPTEGRTVESDLAVANEAMKEPRENIREEQGQDRATSV